MNPRRIPVDRPAWLGIALLAIASCGCANTPGAEAAAREPQVTLALEDAAARSGLPRDSITVVSVEQVTWRDGSLGCPEPDKMYTQALVPGYRITLRAAGQSLDYHADRGGRVLLCPPERAVGPLSPRTDRPTR